MTSSTITSTIQPSISPSIAGGDSGVSITDPSNSNTMYTMDNISETALIDESPNGNDGVIAGAIAVAGHIGNALSFDGINDEVVTPHDANLEGLDISYGGWFYLDSTQQQSTPELMCVYARGDGNGSANNSGLEMRIIGGFLWAIHNVLNNENFTDSNGNNRTGYFITATSSAAFPTDQWVHASHTLSNGKDASLYIDGALDSTVSSVQTIQYSGQGRVNGLRIGSVRTSTTAVNFFTGKSDQIRANDSVWSQSDIDEFYNGGTGA